MLLWPKHKSLFDQRCRTAISTRVVCISRSLKFSLHCRSNTELRKCVLGGRAELTSAVNFTLCSLCVARVIVRLLSILVHLIDTHIASNRVSGNVACLEIC